MARRKTAKELQKQLQYAQAREAYKKPEKEQGAPTRRSPKIALAYKPMTIAAGDAVKNTRFKHQKNLCNSLLKLL